jgi:hypothetical protein
MHADVPDAGTDPAFDAYFASFRAKFAGEPAAAGRTNRAAGGK